MNIVALNVLLPLLFGISIANYTLKEIEIDFSKNFRTFTTAEVAKFDGRDVSKPIYMVIKGVVFDVSSGASFYGKGAPYNALVGKDASRAVAKMSLKPEDLTSDLTGVDDRTLKALDDTFEGTYMKKYPVVGYMDHLVQEVKKRNRSDL